MIQSLRSSARLELLSGWIIHGSMVLLLILLGCPGPVDDTGAEPPTLAGCTSVLRYDQDLDGLLDEVITAVYDDEGQRVEVRWDIDGSGTEDQCDRWIWEEGHAVQRTSDEGCDGSVDQRWTWTWEGGLRVDEVHVERTGDTTRTTWTYDDEGREVEALVDQGDDDSVEDRLSWQWTSDESGRTEQITTDLGDDGVPDEVEELVRDLEDRLVEHTHDQDADGALELRDSRRYGADGLLYLLDRDYLDDGEVESRFWYHWLDEARVDRWELDQGADGSIDGEGIYTWTCP